MAEQTVGIFLINQRGYHNREIMIELYTTLVRPQFESYADCQSPCYRNDAIVLKKKRGAFGMSELEHYMYDKKLDWLQLFPLE